MEDYSDILSQISDLAQELEETTQKITDHQAKQLELRRQLLDLFSERAGLHKQILKITE